MARRLKKECSGAVTVSSDLITGGSVVPLVVLCGQMGIKSIYANNITA